jgi:hypothetical protein
MDTPAQERSSEEILTTIAQLEYRNHQAVEELSEQLAETNVLLGQISRRLLAQSVVAWIQLIGLVLIVLLILLFVVGLLTLPSPLEILGLLG